jgi:hypothetical protein
MMFRNYIRFAGAIIAVISMAGNISAKENVQTSHRKEGLKTTAGNGCKPAGANIDLDINNVRARLMTGGDMWWNLGTSAAAYEIPKNSGKTSQFAASCWIGGYDKQGQLKVAAQTYRQDGNDYWPGALNSLGKISPDTCESWDRFWKVNKSTINQFIQMYKLVGQDIVDVNAYPQFAAITQWPASGNKHATGADQITKLGLNANFSYAPFKDLNGNGIYEPDQGEYPVLESNGVQSIPDQFIWWVFNDAGNVKQQSLTAAIGVEVQTTAFAFATQDFLNDATFCNYRVINRGALTIDSTYLAVWDDCDLGYYLDDFIGCDTSRGLGIQYNATNDDGGSAGHPGQSYGLNPPQVGLDFFQGPLRIIHRSSGTDTFKRLGMTNFTYYNNDGSTIGNPTNGIQIYNYMTGSIRNGQRFSDDFIGPCIPSKGYGTGPVSNFVFWGDPGDNTQWSECACCNNPGDRRFIFSSGPFQLLPGAINDITFGCIWAKGAGGCGATNFKAIRSIDDQAQALFDGHFKTVEGPEAPRMVIRELDRKLIIYLVNDYGSNNYGENYGNTKGVYNDSLQYHQIVTKATGLPDSLYKFEGYRIFQLANSEVTSAEIFDPSTGQVDNTKAFEVFQCDIHNGVTQIVNYVKNTQVIAPTSNAEIKVTGSDKGITHSIELTTDQFATTNDKRFINYHTYYFVAIAYAYNNFAQFDQNNIAVTQDVAYLGSAHAFAGTDIKVATALPNPANGAMGTIVNSDWGDGVAITRIEGVGNGGFDVELDDASEAAVMKDDSVAQASYKVNHGPVAVKVVDPVKVPGYNWALQIGGPNTTTGLADTSTWKLTAFDKNTAVATIYSEKSIALLNEQILEKYGISITTQQVRAPGVNRADGNGYITSDITFADSTKTWLWGVQDEADSSFANWIRSGANKHFIGATDPKTSPCNFNDNTSSNIFLDSMNNFENMLANFSPAKSTWAPYVLAAAYVGKHAGTGTQCGFEVAYTPQTQNFVNFATLPDVDIVFTSDKTKWTRCAVIEQQEDPALAEGFSPTETSSKFMLRRHAGWNGRSDPNSPNTPVYSPDTADNGMSYFPGYAIDQGTGRRLNIVFGEDSYMGSDNGKDMIWNPTSNKFNIYDASIVFGGKHVVYVLNTKYDSCKAFVGNVRAANVNTLKAAYTPMAWVGLPTLNPSIALKTLADGIIPTTTRLRFRVDRPYAPYYAVTDTSNTELPGRYGKNATNPYYTFTTTGLAPTQLSDKSDRNALLDRIYAVPNPYYGYNGYEANRFDTKVRIINLPAQVTIYIYSLDGSLIRTLSKNDPNTPYLDWDIKNTAGLPIASGMYLMDVKAEGLGETVLKWFGAMRPIDVTTY